MDLNEIGDKMRTQKQTIVEKNIHSIEWSATENKINVQIHLISIDFSSVAKINMKRENKQNERE